MSLRLLLSVILVSTAQSPPRVDPQPTPAGRTEIPTPRQILEGELAQLPLLELLRRQPAIAWDRANPGQLLPEVAELLRRAGSGRMTDDEWRVALTETGMITTRDRWPVDMPLQVGIGSQEWLRVSKITLRAVEPNLGEVSFDDLQPARCGTCDGSRAYRAMRLLLDELPPATTRVTFEVTIIQREEPEKLWSQSEETRLLWKGRLERPILAVAKVDDVVPATNEDSERDALRKCLGARWSEVEGSPDELILSVWGTYREFPVLRRLGASLVVELWRGEERVQSMDFVVERAGYWQMDREAACGGLTVGGLDNQLRIPTADLGGWELRVRGEPSKVPGNWEANRWWNGSFSMPLTEVFEHGQR